jgi:hypothetical protein
MSLKNISAEDLLEIISFLGTHGNPIVRLKARVDRYTVQTIIISTIGDEMPINDVKEIGWLDEDGICDFPDDIKNKPNGIFIASDFTDILELVVGLVWNKPGPGFEVFAWDKEQPIPKEVLDRIIGVQMDVETIKYIQDENAGRGILLGEAGGDIQQNGLTPDEWTAKWGTNGVAAIAKQRLFWFANGGGVQTHGPAATSGREPVVLGDPRNVVKR